MEANITPAGKYLSGIARALLSTIALALLCTGMVSAQISPGPLARAHQHLEGVTNCVSCHNYRVGARALKCLECHAEIQRELGARTGYHSRVLKNSSDQRDCARCHMEHNGQKFPLIRLDRKAFNHGAETGFLLEGNHRAQNCEACHNSRKMPAAARVEIKLKDANRSFLGLRRECLSCHEDQHRGQLGADCLRCHAQEAWRPAAGFNHAQTRFPLTGLHQAVACGKCHASRGPDPAALQFKGLSFAACQNCHSDPHHGAFQEAKFRGGCESCHNTGGFRKARPSAGFSHDRTSFPLAGRHAEVACLHCHRDGNFERPIPHDRCQKCHEDPHSGQFAARTSGSDCGACHSETGFKPSLFDRAAHQRGAFALEGKHSSLACGKCHQPEGSAAVYKTRTLACAECHADPHGGEFAAAPDYNNCGLCHSQEAFRPASFNAANHGKTHFPLTGKHSKVDCEACHKPLGREPAAPATVKRMLAVSTAPGASRQYHFPSFACGDCHKDPHQTKAACETCHGTQDWKQPAAFDHAQTHFKLDGGHRDVACVKCHPAADLQHAGTPLFSNTDARCGGCHERDEVHGGQFRTSGRAEDCSACHAPARWKVSEFDHDHSKFPLDRAHRNVSCEKCHKEQPGPNVKLIRVYRNTPTECVKCHEK